MTLGSALAGFAVLAALLTVTPGLDSALVLRATLAQGRRHAVATGAGIVCGVLVWGVAAAVGVSALLTASTVAYDVLRVVGATYMVWLGARMLHGALGRPPAVGDELPAAAPSAAAAWRRGLLTNLLNPKVGAFYVAVLPQFLPAGVPPVAMGCLLALVHVLLSGLWFAVLVLGAGRLRRVLARPRAQRVVDGTTGSVLVGFGLRLGLAAR